MSTVAERRATFKRLHESGCFVIPNPWDAGSARYLEHVGFQALATTSSGMAFAMGRRDGGVPVDDVIAHVATIVAATDLPVNADFEDGFAEDLGALAENVRRCADAGAAGLSIEDAPVAHHAQQYALDVAVERLTAARRALDESHADVLLVARAQNRMSSPEDVDDALRRVPRVRRCRCRRAVRPGGHDRRAHRRCRRSGGAVAGERPRAARDDGRGPVRARRPDGSASPDSLRGSPGPPWQRLRNSFSRRATSVRSWRQVRPT